MGCVPAAIAGTVNEAPTPTTSAAVVSRGPILRDTAAGADRFDAQPSGLRPGGASAAARRRLGALALGADLAEDPLQAGLLGAVDVGHRRRDRRVDRGDPLVHRLGDGAVGRVALASRAQLDQVHRLAGVEVEHVADPVGEAERVGSRRRASRRRPVARTRLGRSPGHARTRRRPRPRAPRRAPRPRGPAPAAATGRSASGGAGGRGSRRSRRRSRSGSAAPRSRGRGGGDGWRGPPPSRRAARRAPRGRARRAGRGSRSPVSPPTRTGRRRAGPPRSRRRGRAPPTGRRRRRRGGRGRAATTQRSVAARRCSR